MSNDRIEQGAQQVNAGYVVFRAFTTSSSIRTQLEYKESSNAMTLHSYLSAIFHGDTTGYDPS